MSNAAPLWRQDIYLRNVAEWWNDYDVLSLDVFDTLLFRDCSEPVDIFDRVGERIAEQFPALGLSPASFRALRREAEQRSRVRKAATGGTHEVTFEDILAEFPCSLEVRAAIAAAERECESEALWLNPTVTSLITDAIADGKRVVLVSDMYHSREQILAFVTRAGFDRGLLTNCFVSSEYGVGKGTGEIFKHVFACFPGLIPDRVLHIGDNDKADVHGAAKAGVRVMHYPVVPQELGSLYDIEKAVYGVRLGELESLRKIAAATHHHPVGSVQEAFHRVGARVIGPAYALFAEWILDHAGQRGLRAVLPLMREGELLADVIARAAAARGADIVCRPVCVSRRPAFVASIHDGNYDERISQSLLRGGRTEREILEELGLGERTDGTSPLETYLAKPKTRAEVLAHARGQRELLIRYLHGVLDGRAALTVDIGTKGTTESYLRDVAAIAPQMPTLSHALMMGSAASNVGHILDGLDISGWLGIAGENDDLISQLKYQVQVLEALVNATSGTTLGYAERDGEVVPLLAAAEVSAEQSELVQACWDGVAAFQEMWLELSAGHPRLLDGLPARKRDVLGILWRFIDAPTFEEASVLGALTYVDSFNAADARALSDSYWPQATKVLVDPTRSRRTFLDHVAADATMSSMLRVIDDIKARGLKSGLIFGASELGRKFQRLTELLDVPLSGYVDSDRRLHGSVIEGLEVHALGGASHDVDYYFIASNIYAGEIRSILQDHYAAAEQKPAIFELAGVS